jgi:hypothetical protein
VEQNIQLMVLLQAMQLDGISLRQLEIRLKALFEKDGILKVELNKALKQKR